MLVTNHPVARRHFPVDPNLQQNLCENLKCRNRSWEQSTYSAENSLGVSFRKMLGGMVTGSCVQ